MRGRAVSQRTSSCLSVKPQTWPALSSLEGKSYTTNSASPAGTLAPAASCATSRSNCWLPATTAASAVSSCVASSIRTRVLSAPGAACSRGGSQLSAHWRGGGFAAAALVVRLLLLLAAAAVMSAPLSPLPAPPPWPTAPTTKGPAGRVPPGAPVAGGPSGPPDALGGGYGIGPVDKHIMRVDAGVA